MYFFNSLQTRNRRKLLNIKEKILPLVKNNQGCPASRANLWNKINLNIVNKKVNVSSCRLHNCLLRNSKNVHRQTVRNNKPRFVSPPLAPRPHCSAPYFPAPRCWACARGTSAPARGTEGRNMAAPSFPTPLHGHVGRGAFTNVYEPAEDTFLLLDALEAAAAELTGCEEDEGPRGRGLGRPAEAAVKESPGKKGCRLPREEAVSAELASMDTRTVPDDFPLDSCNERAGDLSTFAIMLLWSQELHRSLLRQRVSCPQAPESSNVITRLKTKYSGKRGLLI